MAAMTETPDVRPSQIHEHISQDGDSPAVVEVDYFADSHIDSIPICLEVVDVDANASACVWLTIDVAERAALALTEAVILAKKHADYPEG